MGLSNSKYEVNLDDYYCHYRDRQRSDTRSNRHVRRGPVGRYDFPASRRQTKFPSPLVEQTNCDDDGKAQDDDEEHVTTVPSCEVNFAKGSEPADYRTRMEILTYANNCLSMYEKAWHNAGDRSKDSCNEPSYCAAKLVKKRGQYHWRLDFLGRAGETLSVAFDPYHEQQADAWEDKARNKNRPHLRTWSSGESDLFD